MNKLKSIHISGIRGIKDSLVLPLDKRSLLIYGDNGSGKSSITDAIEWFYNDKIAHLAGSEIGKESVRNAFISEKVDSKVELQFSNNKLDAEKTIGSSLRSFISNNSKDFYNYISFSGNENLILRYRDLIQFITATKGEKLNHLQSIIGFNEVREMRSLLNKFAGRFAKEIKTANYSNKKSTQQSILMESLGQNITSENQFFQAATKLIKPLNLEKEIKSYKDAREILKSIETNEETQLVEQINFHNKIAYRLTEIEGEIDEIAKLYKNYQLIFTNLRKDAEKIKKLQLLDLLVEGLKTLNADIVKEDFCPLCQQAKDKIQLIKELSQRIEDLKELQFEKVKLYDHLDEIKAVLQNNLNDINGLLKEKQINEKENLQTLKTIQDLRNSLLEISEELKKDIYSAEPLRESNQIFLEKGEIIVQVELSKKKVKELTNSLKGNLKLQVHTKLSRAIDAYNVYRKIEKELELLTNQQLTFEALYADFIKRQEEALNVFLSMFSGEINKYYTLMNPNEKVEDIKLVPMKDKYDELEGITISYKFYNQNQSPPTALLSDSHINCLGLSFFLASVKAFNKENDFFVLDDVISSFDGNHRTRFIRLLAEEFSNYQIILLTHEKDFFDIASSEVKSKNWLIKSLTWTIEKGASIETPLIDLKAKIEEKFKAKNIDGLGNDIRKYGERQLKHIANNIEANFPFRYNDRNEDRMMSELLSGIQSKIKKYSPSDLNQKNNIDSLIASPILIGNKTSHDSSFTESFGDLEVFWEDEKKLIKLFYCSDEKCKSFISMKNYDSVKNQIRCNCGKICYDWKK